MLGWLLIFFFIGLILWLLLAPIRLILDSNNEVYYLQWYGIAKAGLVMLPDDLVIRLRVFFWKKQFSVFEIKPSGKKKKSIENIPKKKSKQKTNFKTWKRRGITILKSFKVKIFRLNLDTDDFVHNSYLFPIFHLLNAENRRFQINYKGDLELLLVVENRLINIIKAFIF